jgi:hypothetical protein
MRASYGHRLRCFDSRELSHTGSHRLSPEGLPLRSHDSRHGGPQVRGDRSDVLYLCQ